MFSSQDEVVISSSNNGVLADILTPSANATGASFIMPNSSESAFNFSTVGAPSSTLITTYQDNGS